MLRQTPRSQIQRLDRLYRTCQEGEEAAFQAWIEALTDQELDALIALGDVKKAVAEGRLPQTAWTDEQSRQWDEAMSKGKRWRL